MGDVRRHFIRQLFEQIVLFRRGEGCVDGWRRSVGQNLGRSRGDGRRRLLSRRLFNRLWRGLGLNGAHNWLRRRRRRGRRFFKSEHRKIVKVGLWLGGRRRGRFFNRQRWRLGGLERRGFFD